MQTLIKFFVILLDKWQIFIDKILSHSEYFFNLQTPRVWYFILCFSISTVVLIAYFMGPQRSVNEKYLRMFYFPRKNWKQKSNVSSKKEKLSADFSESCKILRLWKKKLTSNPCNRITLTLHIVRGSTREKTELVWK